RRGHHLRRATPEAPGGGCQRSTSRVSAVIERRLRNMTVAALVGLGGAVGAGGAPDALASQRQPDACALFTRQNAERVPGKPARRDANITGSEASTCGYVLEKDAKRVVSLSVGEFASRVEASKAYTKGRVNARFDGFEVESVRRLGKRAYWLPKTNNFERAIVGEKLVVGELTVLTGRRVYTVFIAPPSKTKARDAINLVIAD